MSTRVVEISSDEQCEDVIALGKLMFAEMDTAHLVYDPRCIRENWQALRRDFDRDHMNVFIAYSNAKPVGFIIGRSYPYFFSDQRMSTQELWYVLPEFRSTPAAYKLIHAYEAWARLRGCVEIWSGTAGKALSAQKKVGNMLHRMGYRLTGFYHKKVVTNAVR